MIVVLDTCALVEIVMKKSSANLFHQYIVTANRVVSPELIVAETTNVFYKYYKNKALDQKECIKAIERGLQLIDEYIPSNDLWKEVIPESIKHHHSTYDMMYIITARRNNAKLLTCDNKLLELCKSMHIDVAY